jgi:hypothetical protein
MVALYRQAAEGTLLCGARLTFGDERVARVLLSQDYSAGFVDRHTNQLGGLLRSHMEAAGPAEETDSDA